MRARPININPFSIRLPVSAWVSIGHRISGVILFLLVPLLLIGLDNSLASQEDFDYLSAMIEALHLQWLFWILFASLLFHMLAGIRHLLMDIHVGESLKVSRVTAFSVFAIFVVLMMSAFLMWG